MIKNKFVRKNNFIIKNYRNTSKYGDFNLKIHQNKIVGKMKKNLYGE